MKDVSFEPPGDIRKPVVVPEITADGIATHLCLVECDPRFLAWQRRVHQIKLRRPSDHMDRRHTGAGKQTPGEACGMTRDS